ncbi:DHBP synthase RibB-like alpha/beta domain-containing protein [Cladochytrium replicatum]|nr:DHBP synthase RibB-like alpha/beta domain-containing protein [Cladochytrium replicatum]
MTFTKVRKLGRRSFPFPDDQTIGLIAGCPTDEGYPSHLFDPPAPFSLNDNPPTQSYNADVDAISEAADLLRSGETVAFPTETVYGLAANALDSAAVSAIFRAKGRPSDNPLIVHISSLKMLEEILPPLIGEDQSAGHRRTRIPSIYLPVIAKHWPGPLTILLPRSFLVPATVTGGHDTVAVRFPSHPIARALIAKCNFPLAAPSANTSGRPSPTTAGHVYDDLRNRIPLILEDATGSPDSGVESTVLDAIKSVPPAILRPGGVTFEMLQKILPRGEVRVYRKDFTDAALENAPTTPGMKYRHYTPEAEVVLFESAQGSARSSAVLRRAVSAEISRLLADNVSPAHIGVLRTSKRDPGEVNGTSSEVQEFDMGDALAPDTVAKRLFLGLRELEGRGVKILLVEGVPEVHEGLAVMNRLRKAASRTIYV